MEPNPYASPTCHPIDQATKSKPSWLTFYFAYPFTLGAFLMCATLPYACSEGHFHTDCRTAIKLLLAESATTAILGIMAISSLDATLGRAVCFSHLVVTGAMLPMLVRLYWRDIRYTHILPTLLTFACVDLLLLHSAFRRFERSSWRANLTHGMILLLDAGIIIDEYLRPYSGWFKLGSVLRELCLDFGQGIICVLLWLRMRDVRRESRLEQSQETENCDSAKPL